MPRNPIAFTIAFLLPVAFVAGVQLRGVYTFLVPFLVLVVIPLLDMLIGANATNATEEELEKLRNARGFRWVTYLWVPTQVGLLVWAVTVAAQVSLRPFEVTGLILSMGLITGGIGITVAHELIHRDTRLETTLGQVLLMTVCYMHFRIEHVYGHHRYVATPRDPASARRGESIYAFYPRTVFGGFRSAWHIEVDRLRAKGLSPWSLHNRMLWYLALPLLFGAVLALLFDGLALPFFFAQSVVAFSLLEMVNYIEHYGLERREIEPGRWERVSVQHSWDSNNVLTNAYLFGLQRHADHHLYPRRRYQVLRSYEKSPQLPTGYAGMLWLTLVPVLWRKVMDERLVAYRQELAA